MITSLSEDIGMRKSHLNDYDIVCKRLDNFIEKINEKIVNRIQLVKQVYLEDYKQQVSLMAAQLKSIRAVLDQQQLKQRSNERLFHLQEQRDFFRAQVIKLNEDLRKLNAQNHQIKTQLSETKHQCANYKKIAYDLETKIYKLTYENIEMQKIKEDTAKNPQSTINPSTGTFIQFGKSDNKVLNAHRQNDSASNYSGRTERDKAASYSLRKLKPSKSMATVTHAELLKMKASNQPNKREQILDGCIKELKKQIYYRNLPTKETGIIHFDEGQKISFNKFTKSDKKQLVYRFMSNPQILEEFYRYIFDKKKEKDIDRQTSTRGFEKLVLAKGVDAKFNTKMLMNYKTEFDRKIYDIKANRF